MTKKLQGQKRTDGGKTKKQQRSEEDRAGEGEEWCNTEGGVRQRHRQAYKKKKRVTNIEENGSHRELSLSNSLSVYSLI